MGNSPPASCPKKNYLVSGRLADLDPVFHPPSKGARPSVTAARNLGRRGLGIGSPQSSWIGACKGERGGGLGS